MKRKTKTKKPTSKRRSTTAVGGIYSFKKIIISFFSIAILLAVVVLPNKTAVSQSVAGASILKGMYVQSTITWKPIPNAVWYNIYYKTAADTKYTNAVRSIPARATTYTISYLKKDTNYLYKVSAVNGSGKEIWWSTEAPMPYITGM